MTVVVFGGAGFLGSKLIQSISADRVLSLPATEVANPKFLVVDVPGANAPENVENSEFAFGDISDPNFVMDVLPSDTSAIFHLAAVVSSAAEADFDLGMRVNVQGTINVLEAARALERFVPVLCTSSLAVFGDGVEPPLDELSPTHPNSSYGVQKAVSELVAYDYRRKGFADARTVRLPTVVVRPGKPNAAASSFASSIIREPMQGLEAKLPVHKDLAMWIASPEGVVDSLIHAMQVKSADWPDVPAVNLPGITVTVKQMLDVLSDLEGEQVLSLVEDQFDERISRIVSSWPKEFDLDVSTKLGFVRDMDFRNIAERFKRQLSDP